MIIRRIEPQQPVRKKRAAAYCRVSTNLQEESYETQYTVYKKMIESNPEYEFAGIYSDKGKSGTSYKHRPGFQQMIADADEKKFDVLYVKSISRFARNVGDCQRYVDMLREKGIVIFFEREHIRTDDPSSNFALALIGAVSQDESHSISKNVAMGYHERFARGKFNLGNNRILGFDTNKEGKLVPNGDAWIIREIYDMYIKGETYHGIARALNEKGAKTLMGKPFNAPGIRYILGNETYVGDKHLQKNPPKDYITHKPDPNEHAPDYYLRDDHEGIISREVWEKVKAKLERAGTDMENGAKHCTEHHFLYGKVICGECGAIFKRRTLTGRDGTYYKVWNCSERQKGRRGNGCKCRIIREEELIEAIREALEWSVMDEARFNREIVRVVIHEDELELIMKEAA